MTILKDIDNLLLNQEFFGFGKATPTGPHSEEFLQYVDFFKEIDIVDDRNNQTLDYYKDCAKSNNDVVSGYPCYLEYVYNLFIYMAFIKVLIYADSTGKSTKSIRTLQQIDKLKSGTDIDHAFSGSYKLTKKIFNEVMTKPAANKLFKEIEKILVKQYIPNVKEMVEG
jgi:hypothetical protein